MPFFFFIRLFLKYEMPKYPKHWSKIAATPSQGSAGPYNLLQWTQVGQ
jgi:hypothetical protein